MERVPIPPWLTGTGYVDIPAEPQALSIELYPSCDSIDDDQDKGQVATSTYCGGDESFDINLNNQASYGEESKEMSSSPDFEADSALENAFSMQPLQAVLKDIENSTSQYQGIESVQVPQFECNAYIYNEGRHGMRREIRSQVSTKQLGAFVSKPYTIAASTAHGHPRALYSECGPNERVHRGMPNLLITPPWSLFMYQPRRRKVRFVEPTAESIIPEAVIQVISIFLCLSSNLYVRQTQETNDSINPASSRRNKKGRRSLVNKNTFGRSSSVDSL